MPNLAAGVFQGREEDFDYQVKITPQYEVSDPLGELAHILFFDPGSRYPGRGRQQNKMLILETVRTAPSKKP